MSFRPRRSVLYIPGNNPRALEKAASIAVDTIILDLEDAVAPAAKADARTMVEAALNANIFGQKEVVLRINGMETEEAAEDLAIAANANAVLVPKINDAHEIARAEAALDAISEGSGPALWAMIETPRAILNLASIASEASRPGSRLACFVLGTNDLAKETRVQITGSRLALLNWMSQTVIAAKAYGLTVLDGVYNDFKDGDGFTSECRQGRALGFDGKTLIHPNQIDKANEIFGPSTAEIAEAQAIVAAFALPENEGKGVIPLNGRMIERLHLAMAQQLLENVRLITGH